MPTAFLKRIFGVAATMFFFTFLAAPALAQEQLPPHSEYSFWASGAYGNGHAFCSTVIGRNYQLESRYGRLIYWSKPFAVRWIVEIPGAFVGYPLVSAGRRSYFYGFGGSPTGAQVNIVHNRRIEPFATSSGGFLYFNHRMFGPAETRFNFTAQIGGGLQFFTADRHASLDIGYKYHHISNANLGKDNPGMDSHMLFVGISLLP